MAILVCIAASGPALAAKVTLSRFLVIGRLNAIPFRIIAVVYPFVRTDIYRLDLLTTIFGLTEGFEQLFERGKGKGGH